MFQKRELQTSGELK